MTDPDKLRDEGMAQAEAHADSRVIAIIDALIDAANASGKPWSANDIRDGISVTSQGLVGARVRAAAMRRPAEMVKVGEVPSNLGSTHSKPIALWIGAHPKPMKRDDMIDWLDLLPQEEHQRRIAEARACRRSA